MRLTPPADVTSAPSGGQPTRWLLLALPMALALLIYHPYRTLPIDVWDFREFIPVLQRASGFRDQVIALLAYYAHHGRMNPLFYATFVLQYRWFGSDASGWQWLRFAWMSLDAILLVLVCRRIGLRTVAGIAAVGVLVTATPAVRAWVQLMAEPQGLAAILGATWLALDYRVTPRWRRSAFWITVLVAVAFLSKEVVGSLGLIVLLVAIFSRRAPGEPIVTRRHLILAALLGVVVLAELAMLLTVRSRPGATGYGMAYGTGALSPARFGANLVAILLPVRPGTDARLGLLYPANVLAILVLVLGLTTRLRRAAADSTLVALVTLGLLTSIIGAAVYLPWPKFDSFYGVPFLAGPLILYAAAVDELLAARGVRRGFAVAAMVLIPGYAAIAANRSVESSAASLRLNADLARLIGRFSHDDTVLVLSPPAGPRALPVQADELRDYSLALGWLDPTRGAAVLPAPCERFRPGIDGGATGPVFVSYSYGCGRLPNPVLRINSGFQWRDWWNLAVRHDTMTLDLSGLAVQRLLRVRKTP